jgi:hypothetical protein
MYRSFDAAYSREPLSKRYATRILIALGMGEQTKKCYRPADMAKLRLTLLGGFEARTDSGLSLAISRKNAQMLLAYLAMHPKQTHLRDTASMARPMRAAGVAGKAFMGASRPGSGTAVGGQSWANAPAPLEFRVRLFL